MHTFPAMRSRDRSNYAHFLIHFILCYLRAYQALQRHPLVHLVNINLIRTERHLYPLKPISADGSVALPQLVSVLVTRQAKPYWLVSFCECLSDEV